MTYIPLTVYSGQECIGFVTQAADSYWAALADGRQLGAFASWREAMAAISVACGRSAERPT